ncbi:signal peptide peptidase SppA [Lysobacter sp. FW306-1B-D06B]|uniref:signal peptide peptidase SppA n=1 Tax=Lysobacter sp. FW306-1B-D06B TaxID=3140250 RepID=UPI0031401ACF
MVRRDREIVAFVTLTYYDLEGVAASPFGVGIRALWASRIFRMFRPRNVAQQSGNCLVTKTMSEIKHSAVGRFLSKLSNALRIARTITVNVAFLAIVAFYAFALFGLFRVKPILERTTLVIEPKGTLVEQYDDDPIARALDRAAGGKGEVQLRDLIRVLEGASSDPRIDRIALRLDELKLNGLASTNELAKAVAQARTAGKQVIASADSLTQSQFQVVAQASELYLDPKGEIHLNGFAVYMPYFREALQDKLGVDVSVFKVGTYKSATEPFVQDAASPEAKQAESDVLNDQWKHYLADIAKARRLDVASIEHGIDHMPAALAEVGGNPARLALKAKLVDGLRTRNEVDHLLKARGEPDMGAKSGFRQASVAEYLAVLDKEAAKSRGKAKVAIVVAEGSIVRGDGSAGQVGGNSTSELLRKAAEDEDVKAVVLRVNSPGGEVFASEQISREVLRLRKAGKPVVASMGDYAASGGYQISMNADRIFASPSTVTGSIGVFGLKFDVSPALEKLGVRIDGVSTTKYAGATSIARPMPQEYRDVAQQMVERVYHDFIEEVAAARSMAPGKVESAAQGRIWTGAKAKELGLVDELGGLQQAITFAAQKAKLGNPDTYAIEYVERDLKPIEKFLRRLASSKTGQMALQESGVASALLVRVVPETTGTVKFIEEYMTQQNGHALKVMAHCLCTY